MTRFPDQFLDDLRQRVAVSTVAGKTVQLKRQGSEFIGLSPFNAEKSPSFTVNDAKGFFHDFSSGKHGDVFAFLQETTGCEFPEAVKQIAELAGVPLPVDRHQSGNGRDRERNSGSHRAGNDPSDDAGGHPRDGGERLSKRQITKAYDYTDAQGDLIYQVCRIEWTDNGKHKKTFIQRRPTPDDDGHWIWGLSGGDFLKGCDGDWYQATDERAEKWHGAERRTFPDKVEHGLYKLVEFRELRGGDEPDFIPEGEKDTETLIEWGFAATTNSGGARNWRAEHAEMFRGRDVILPIDNDDAGRARAAIIGRSLRGIARSVRVLDFAKVWQYAPKGADVTDWRDASGGSAEKLRAMLAKLPEWRPPPHVSKFGGYPFEDLDMPGPEHEFVIDDWMTVGDKSVIGGPSKSGKSFLATLKAWCIATGKPFFGHKIVAPGLVIYQVGEGVRGAKKRFRAIRQYMGARAGQRVPIYILQSKVDLHSPQGDTVGLIEEIKAIADQYDVPLRAIFIDTLSKASGIADENSGKDMAMIMDNVDKIADAVPGAHVCLVHHMNAGGTKLRGHTSVYANVDQVILVNKNEDGKTRTAILDKQKDGEDGLEIKFELFTVEVGQRALDNKPITSAVVIPIGGSVELKGRGKPQERTLKLTNERAVILEALRQALEEKGEPTPAHLKLPKSIKTVVHSKRWKEFYLSKAPDAETATENTINKRMRDASTQFQHLRVIGRINPYVWLTGRAVAGVVEGRGSYGEPTTDPSAPVLPMEEPPPAEFPESDIPDNGANA